MTNHNERRGVSVLAPSRFQPNDGSVTLDRYTGGMTTNENIHRVRRLRSFALGQIELGRQMTSRGESILRILALVERGEDPMAPESDDKSAGPEQ